MPGTMAMDNAKPNVRPAKESLHFPILAPGFRIAAEKIALAGEPEEWLEIASPPKSHAATLSFSLVCSGCRQNVQHLSEALRRRSRGEDVVIGVVETHGRKGIEELHRKY